MKSIISLKAFLVALMFGSFALGAPKSNAESQAADWLKLNGKHLETETIAKADSTWSEGVIT